MSHDAGDSTEHLRARAEALKSGASVEARAAAAAGVAREFAQGTLGERERRIALEILEQMARDVERQVREALAEHVKHCPFLPPSIARTLAEDVASVAVPLLQFSGVLSDEDLLLVVQRGEEEKQVAVARREGLGAQVSDALVEAGSERVVGVLLANHSAEIAEPSLRKALDAHAGSERIRALLVERPILPLTISERLISMVSTELRERLITRHHIPPELAEELARQGKERALTQVVTDDSPHAEFARLAASLHQRKALTPTLVLRALCVGDLDFFQAAMAELAGIPFGNAGPLIYDKGRDGLEAIYRQSGLPGELFSAFRAGIEVVKDTAAETPGTRRRALAERIVRRLSLEYDTVCPEGLEHMLSQLSRLVTARPTSAARGLV